YVKYLRMSYGLGPNEGWINLKRNPAAFAIFEQLPRDLGEKVIQEFVNLLKGGFHTQAADILAGPAWRLREQLLPRLREVDPFHLRAFAKVLDSKAINIAVPGVTPTASQRR